MAMPIIAYAMFDYAIFSLSAITPLAPLPPLLITVLPPALPTRHFTPPYRRLRYYIILIRCHHYRHAAIRFTILAHC